MRKFKFFSGYSKMTIVGQWDSDMMNDLNAFHNIDVEAELTNLLSEEISRTIDGEIMSNLMRNINGGYNI